MIESLEVNSSEPLSSLTFIQKARNSTQVIWLGRLAAYDKAIVNQ